MTVCTGNICRSPAAEFLLRQVLDASVEVTSAGVYGMPAWPVSPPMAQLLAADGVAGSELSAFRSRQLTPQLIRGADLILTAAAEHNAAVLELDPLALRRTFTLRAFADLAAVAVSTGSVSTEPVSKGSVSTEPVSTGSVRKGSVRKGSVRNRDEAHLEPDNATPAVIHNAELHNAERHSANLEPAGVENNDAQALARLVPAALAARSGPRLGGLARLNSRARNTDIADPYGRGDAAYQASYQEIKRAVSQIAASVDAART